MLNNSFVKQDKLTSFFQEIIASEIKRRIPKNFVEGFNPCNITECDRRIFYKSTGETPIIPEKISLYHVLEKRSQEATKNKWLNLFDNSKRIKLLQKNVIAADAKYNIHGIIDGIIKIGDLSAVIMIRSVRNDEFEKVVKKNAIRKHVVEQMVKMWLVEIAHGIILYENKETNEICLYHITPHAQLLENVKKKCQKLQLLKSKGERPARAYKNDKGQECLSCEFNITCWTQK